MSESSPADSEVIFVVDDDASVRRSLDRLLTSAGYAVETFESAESFFEHHPKSMVGCIVLDVRMNGLDGLGLQRRLDETGCLLPVIFLTGHGDIPMSVEAMKLGAEDFLTKPVDDERLIGVVEKALNRCRERMAQFGEETTIRRRVDTLSQRELEVMRCLLTGALNKQVAAHLGIVEKTVKVHRARIMEKMGVHSVAELVHLCGQIGVEPDPMRERGNSGPAAGCD